MGKYKLHILSMETNTTKTIESCEIGHLVQNHAMSH